MSNNLEKYYKTYLSHAESQQVNLYTYEAMIDKDKVLPLVAIFVPTPNLTIHEFHVARGLAQTVEAQRDADWERGMLWLTALKELLTVAAHSNNCGVFVNIGDHVEFNPDGCTCPHGRATALLAQLFAQKEER